MKRYQNRKAFTIVEMVIVIAVIAILAAAMIPAVSGVIRQANISADRQFAASLNIQLAMESVDREIQNENDLKDVINKYYGADYFETQLSPKSAKHGYYFWYDYTNKTVIVGTTEEIADLAAHTPTAPTMSAVPMIGGGKGTFSPASLRSDLIPGYYLLGCKGGVLSTIAKLEGIDDEQDYENTLNELKAAGDTLEKKLFGKVSVTTIETDYGIFACDGEQEHWYRSVSTTNVDDKLVYVYYPDKVVDDVEGIVEKTDKDPENPPIKVAPGGIQIEISSDTKVGDGAWSGLFDGKVEVHVNVTDKEQLKDIFHMGAMDGAMVIVVPGGVLPNGNECYFDPDNAFEIVYNDENGDKQIVVEVEPQGGMESINVEITYNNSGNVGTDADYFYEGTLYLAWDFGSAKLTLKDKLSNSLVNWTVSEDALIQVSSKGEITLKDGAIPNKDKSLATVTATLKKDPAKTHSINVQLVFPYDLTWKIADKACDSTVELSYTAESTQFAITDKVVKYTQNNVVKMNDSSLVWNFTTSGDLFAIENNSALKLDPAKLGASSTQAMTVTYGDYVTKTCQVTIVNNSSTPFEKKNITENIKIGATYLFRVGNGNEFTLGKLFQSADSKNVGIEITDLTSAGENIPLGQNSNFKATINGTAATGKWTLDSNWANAKVKFTGTGVVKVRIGNLLADGTFYGYIELYLEVVDAINATTAVSATSNNVVLLNDVTVADASNDYANILNVYNDYTIYGNGFAIYLPKDHLANNAGFTGYVKLGNANGTGGNLDNVRIVGPVYPAAYVEANNAKDGDVWKYFYNSVMVVNGDCTISNSYISGSRAALYIASGNNILIDDTTLEGGSFANMHIAGGINVTLKDLTTIQTKRVSDSVYGTQKETFGVGVYGSSSTTVIKVEGELNQYNWMTKSEAGTYAPSITGLSSAYQAFFDEAKFKHTFGGAEYINYAFLFFEVEPQISGYSGYAECVKDNGVYYAVFISNDKQNGGTLTNELKNAPAYATDGFNPVAPKFNFDNSPNHDADDTNDAADTYCVFNNGALNIGIKGTSKTIDLSKVTAVKNGGALQLKKALNGKEITGDTVEIKFADGVKQTLTFTAVADAGYNKDGVANSGSVTYTWSVTVNIAQLSFDKPVWNMGGVYKFEGTSNILYTYYSTSQGYAEAVPIFNGIKVTYVDKNGTKQNLDLSSVTTHPVKSADNSLKYIYTLAGGETLSITLKNAGWKNSPTAFFLTTYNNKVYVYPQGVDNDNYVRAKVKNQDFNISIVYNFTDSHGQSTGDQTVQWYNAKDSNGNVTTVQWQTFDGTNGKKPSTCVTPDTLVTLADGTQKQIQYVTYEDMLLVWDFNTGKYDVMPASIIQNHGYDNYTVVTLNFSDGTTVNTINGHGFFDVAERKYVIIGKNNVADYVGREFAKVDGDSYSTVTLESFSVSEKHTESWSILTAVQYNCILENMWTLTPAEVEGSPDYLMPFEIGADMKYDEAKMQADIEKYGLYTYEDFADYCTYEQFVGFGFANFKVSVEKGYITWDDIEFLLNLHLGGTK